MKKIIFTGKGGVGKTTILSTLARLLSRDGYRVLVIDCDPSMNLAMSLGVSLSDVKSLVDNKESFQESLGIDGDLGESGHEHGHGADSVVEAVIDDYVLDASDGVKLVVMGNIPYGGAGCLCSSIALIKLLVGRISSDPDNLDFVMIDSQAGVEIFGRGMASKFDMAMVITEPTPKSLEVARHGIKLSKDLGVLRQVVIANKVEDQSECDDISRQLNLQAGQVYSVGYDRAAVEADKKGLLILDHMPEARIIKDVQRIKKVVVEV